MTGGSKSLYCFRSTGSGVIFTQKLEAQTNTCTHLQNIQGPPGGIFTLLASIGFQRKGLSETLHEEAGEGLPE